MKPVLVLSLCYFVVGTILLHEEARAAVDSVAADSMALYKNFDLVGGPKSIGRQMEIDQNGPQFEHRIPIRVFKPWYAWKKKLQDDVGLQFSIQYMAVGIMSNITISDPGTPTAGSGILNIQGGLTLVDREGDNTGTLFMRLASRHSYGSAATSPMFHGLTESGYYGLPAVGYRDYSFRMLELNWQQQLFGGAASVIAGKIDPSGYFNFHGLVVPWQHFLGWGSSVSGTINWPDMGLGAIVSVRPTENIYITACLSDVVGDLYRDGEFFDLGRNFENGDFIYFAEVGYVPSIEERFFKKVSITAWRSDAYTSVSGTPIEVGQGAAFSAHWMFEERFVPFLRAGFSNGVGENAFYTFDLQVGHGLRFSTYDILGTSFSVAQPNVDGSELQYTAEAFYRINLTSHLEITPSVQWIGNPTLNPNASSLFYGGIRGRVTL